MPTVPCEFERFVPRDQWFWYGSGPGKLTKGMRKRKIRCPLCKKRLTLRSIAGHDSEMFYRVPPHKTTAKRLGVQLKLPFIKKR